MFIIVLHRVRFRVKCLKQGIKNWNSVLNRVRKSAIFVTGSGDEDSGRTCLAPRPTETRQGQHLSTQGYIE